MKNILVLSILFLLFSCKKESVVPEKTDWEEMANGIWKLSVGKKQGLNLLDAANIEPKIDRLNQFPISKFPLDTSLIKIRKENNKIFVQLPLDKAEQIYGLGLHFKTVNRRGNIYTLKMDHYGGRDNGRTHAPVPFYVSSNGYGVLINSARYITVYVGTTVRVDSPNQPVVRDRNIDKNWESQPASDMIEIVIPDTNAELLVFDGDTPMDVVRKYNLYSGGGVLPPKWGLGFTYRTNTKFSSDEILKLTEEFEEKGFPLDFIGLEPGWMNMSYPCSYEWDTKRFPNPKEFVNNLLNKGIRTNLWVNPYIAPKAKLYKKMLPLSASHSVWSGIIPDYTLPETRQIFADFYKENQLDIGVSGLKIDEVDGHDFWLWPDTATFPSEIDAEQMRQIYAVLLQEMVAKLYYEKNERTYGLVRGSNAGASRFPFVIYNDYYKHEDFITALINSGFSGVLWTPEVRSSKTGEEWLRRMQSVCFSPMAMINAWSSGTLPWSYPEVYDEVKEIAMLRMRLLPYIYSTFADYHFNGTPPIRPMPLVDGFSVNEKIIEGELDGTKNPYKMATRKEILDQFMFGDNLLVAPLFVGQTSREVILPKGKWYDFYSGKFVGAGEVIQVTAKLSEIPLFVKNGGLIPLIPERLHSPKNGEKLDLEIRHYGTSEGTFMLYDDDGETFDYEKGDFSWTKLSVDTNSEGIQKGTSKREKGTVFSYENSTWKFMTKN